MVVRYCEKQALSGGRVATRRCLDLPAYLILAGSERMSASGFEAKASFL